METKHTKTFEECCDEIAKALSWENMESILSSGMIPVNKIFFVAKAAILFNSETAKERDELKEYNELLKIETDNTKALLASCEKALDERDKEIVTLKQLNSELAERLAKSLISKAKEQDK